jgi:hypothetical protein
MRCQEFFVDARPMVETVHVGRRDELHQVIPTVLVLGQENEVMVRSLRAERAPGTLLPAAGGHVHLAPQHRRDSRFPGCAVKFVGTKEVAMVRQGDRVHADLRDLVH